MYNMIVRTTAMCVYTYVLRKTTDMHAVRPVTSTHLLEGGIGVFESDFQL